MSLLESEVTNNALGSGVHIRPRANRAQWRTSCCVSQTKTGREFRLANPWFRLYSEFADDAKVQMMSEPMQRRLVMLMCLRCKDATLHARQLAFYLRISASELAETKEVFIENGFIDEDWELVNWNRRQFVSDSSTERVRRSRQRKKQYETLQKNAQEDGHKGVQQECSFAPTAPDTEQSRKQKKQARQAVEALAEETLQRAKALVSACGPGGPAGVQWRRRSFSPFPAAQNRTGGTQ